MNKVIDDVLYMELHLCFFCHLKMEEISQETYYCPRCDAYKTQTEPRMVSQMHPAPTEYVHFFERSYRDQIYKFLFNEDGSVFTLLKRDSWGFEEEIMKGQEMTNITPLNWQQKLPTLVTFS